MADELERRIYGPEQRAPRDNRFLYGALGLIAGPIGVLAAGFMLRGKEEEIGQKHTFWTNPVTIVACAIILPFTGFFYGMELANLEIKQDKMHAQQSQQQRAQSSYGANHSHELTREAGTQWRQKVSEERAAATNLQAQR